MKPTVIIIAIAAAIASMTIAAFLGGIGRQSQWGQADPRNTRQVALGEQVSASEWAGAG